MYRTPEFTKAIKEYFDLDDKETFNSLKVMEESDQNKILIALTSKLYDYLVDKIDDIDFGDIPKSKGDVTKLPNYEKIVDCVDIIEQILVNSKQPIDTILTIKNAIKNLITHKDIFIRGYQTETELPIVIYNTMVLSIYSSISLLISSCIEFIKSTDDSGFDIALDKVQLRKTSESLLFKDLKTLNASFENNSLPNALDSIIKSGAKKAIGEDVIAGVAITGAAIAVVLNIIPVLRELTYFFFYARVKVSDYFDAQSALLQMNAYNLASRATTNIKNIKEIQKKQLKISNLFKKVSNFIAVKHNKAKVSTEKDNKILEKKLKIDDVKKIDIDNTSQSIW